MKDLILKESTFFSDMQKTVVPYLSERKTESWIAREPGRNLYYVRYLADDAVGTVVISHGFTETAEKYQEVIYYFLKRHYHVYMPEHCGHGHSYRLVKDLSLVHVDSFKRYVRDLLAVAHIAKKEQNGLPLFLYAHSMGGGIGAAVLAAEPKLFQKAVLSSPMIRPLTAGVPWPAAKFAANVLCKAGKSEEYVPGGHAFDENERFEASASTCWVRFEFYQQKRNAEPLYQMCVASCGWLNQAVKLNRYLRKRAWQKIETPFVIFQAEDDAFVNGKEQRLFADQVNSAQKTSAKVVAVPDTKHEIYNSSSEVVERYWGLIFEYLSLRM